MSKNPPSSNQYPDYFNLNNPLLNYFGNNNLADEDLKLLKNDIKVSNLNPYVKALSALNKPQNNLEYNDFSINTHNLNSNTFNKYGYADFFKKKKKINQISSTSSFHSSNNNYLNMDPHNFTDNSNILNINKSLNLVTPHLTNVKLQSQIMANNNNVKKSLNDNSQANINNSNDSDQIFNNLVQTNVNSNAHITYNLIQIEKEINDYIKKKSTTLQHYWKNNLIALKFEKIFSKWYDYLSPRNLDFYSKQMLLSHNLVGIPSINDEEIVMVNVKQSNRILIRRMERNLRRTPLLVKQHVHPSRRKHAIKRERTTNGRFLSKNNDKVLNDKNVT